MSDPDTKNAVPAADDLSFVGALMTNISQSYCVDTGRIFSSGMSNGGGFNGVMLCDPVLSTRFAAFGFHSGALYGSVPNGPNCVPSTMVIDTIPQPMNCQPGRSNIPILEFHGDNDNTISYFGDNSHRGYCLPLIPHYVQVW